MSKIKEIMDAWPLPKGEPIEGKTYIADGWIYRDLPKIKEKLFNEFVDLVGTDNIVFLTKAEYKIDGEIYKRGQILISPQGVENCKNRVKQ